MGWGLCCASPCLGVMQRLIGNVRRESCWTEIGSGGSPPLCPCLPGQAAGLSVDPCGYDLSCFLPEFKTKTKVIIAYVLVASSVGDRKVCCVWHVCSKEMVWTDVF